MIKASIYPSPGLCQGLQQGLLSVCHNRLACQANRQRR